MAFGSLSPWGNLSPWGSLAGLPPSPPDEVPRDVRRWLFHRLRPRLDPVPLYPALPQDEALPAVTFAVLSGWDLRSYGGSAEADTSQYRVRITCWADEWGDAVDAAAVVKQALRDHSDGFVKDCWLLMDLDQPVPPDEGDGDRWTYQQILDFQVVTRN